MLYCKALFVLLHHYFHIKLHFHWLSLRFCENMFVFSPIAILVFNILASRTECTFNPFFSFKTLIFSRIVFQLTLKNNPLHVLTDGGCSLCQIHLSMRFLRGSHPQQDFHRCPSPLYLSMPTSSV